MAKLKPGSSYKATFLAPAMGVPTETIELGKVIEYEPKKRIVVEAAVQTFAKYGETFRPVTRRIFEVLPSGNTRIKTLAAIVFISSVNGMIKGMIQKGALQGMRDTFAKMETILSDEAKVRPYQEGTGVSYGLPPSSTVVSGVATPSELKNGLEAIVGTAIVEALDPWAGFIYAALAHLPFLGGMTSDSVLCIIVAFFSFEIVRICLLVMKFCASAGRHPQDSLSWVSYYIFKFVYVPQSVTEVFTTVMIALFAREVMVKFASLLPQPPSSGSRPSSAAGTSVGAAGAGSEGQNGVKYDGYGKAIAGTNKNYVGKGNKTLETLDGKSEVALDAIRQGLLEIGKLGQSNRQRARQNRHDKREKIAEKINERRNQHAQSKHKAGVGGSTVVSPTADAAAVAAAAAAAWGGGDGGGTPNALSGTASPLSPVDYGASPGSEYDPYEAALLEDPHNLSTEGYSGPELSPRLRSCAVVESIFENERLQPFRGWGHDWPGHFLPTDRVLHWSTNDLGEAPDSLASQSIKEVAPMPPPGWRWVEPKWHLDLSGVFSDSTDNYGWSYGLDFAWVVYPFVPGTGRKKMADFVRRRRWLRTRVPLLVGKESSNNNDNGGGSGGGGGEGTTMSSGETNSSSSSSGSTGGAVEEALQQSFTGAFGSAVEDLELLPSEEIPEVKNEAIVEVERELEENLGETTPATRLPAPLRQSVAEDEKKA